MTVVSDEASGDDDQEGERVVALDRWPDEVGQQLIFRARDRSLSPLLSTTTASERLVPARTHQHDPPQE